MFAHQYFNMCKEAKDELENIRVFSSTPMEPGKISQMGTFAFKKGDYFHHPDMGEDEVREVAQDDKRNLRASDDSRPFRKEECVWIPTAEQLIEEAKRMVFSIPNVDVLHKYFAGTIFDGLSDEELALAYFMKHHDNKEWDFENQRWVRI